MFKFDFSQFNERPSKNESANIVWLESKEIIPNEEIIPTNINLISDCNNFQCKNNKIIKYLSTNYIIKNMKEKQVKNSIISAESNHSDLITGVYEGGLKIWECTKDLLEFICDEQINLKKKIVLDLGCGVGIVGIFSLLNGANVYFQDYNSEVITSVTIPNVSLNLKNVENILSTSKFYSGDWQSFANILQERNIKFDYIFTSETIYNVNNYNKLHSVFINYLKEDGVIYVAAKTYYFGVGGGLRCLEDFVEKQGILDCKINWKCTAGITREILKLTWKQ